MPSTMRSRLSTNPVLEIANAIGIAWSRSGVLAYTTTNGDDEEIRTWEPSHNGERFWCAARAPLRNVGWFGDRIAWTGAGHVHAVASDGGRVSWILPTPVPPRYADRAWSLTQAAYASNGQDLVVIESKPAMLGGTDYRMQLATCQPGHGEVALESAPIVLGKVVPAPKFTAAGLLFTAEGAAVTSWHLDSDPTSGRRTLTRGSQWRPAGTSAPSFELDPNGGTLVAMRGTGLAGLPCIVSMEGRGGDLGRFEGTNSLSVAAGLVAIQDGTRCHFFDVNDGMLASVELYAGDSPLIALAPDASMLAVWSYSPIKVLKVYKLQRIRLEPEPHERLLEALEHFLDATEAIHRRQIETAEVAKAETADLRQLLRELRVTTANEAQRAEAFQRKQLQTLRRLVEYAERDTVANTQSADRAYLATLLPDVINGILGNSAYDLLKRLFGLGS